MGLPAHPRRTGHAGHPRGALNRVGDPHRRRHLLGPHRDTGPRWAQFLLSQAEALLAADFIVTDLLDGTKVYVPAVIEHATRRVRVLGTTTHRTGWCNKPA